MTLWLLRHAQVLAPPGTCYGVTDLAADPEATLRAAASFGPSPAVGSAVWCSPSARATQLAQALASLRPDLATARLDPRLREMDFGHWEMRPWAEIPREAVDAWTDDFAHHRFGGRESAQELIDRVALALDEARRVAAPELVWVTHAGVIRAVQFLVGAEAAGARTIASAAQWPVEAPAMGEWVRLRL